MNIIPTVLGSIILGGVAYFLRAHGYQANYFFAMCAGGLIGLALSWLVSKAASRELRLVRYTRITNALPSKPPLIELVEREDMLFYRSHSVSRESKISEILLPAKRVTLCATYLGDVPVVHERRLCVKNKLLAFLALTRQEFLDYKVVVPFDQMP